MYNCYLTIQWTNILIKLVHHTKIFIAHHNFQTIESLVNDAIIIEDARITQIISNPTDLKKLSQTY